MQRLFDNEKLRGIEATHCGHQLITKVGNIMINKRIVRLALFVVMSVVTLFAAQSAMATLAVTSINNQQVYTFDNSGNGTFRAGSPDFFTPTGVTYGSPGPNGDLIVSDTLFLNGILKRIDPVNTVTNFTAPFSAAVTPVGLGTDPFGNVYSANYLTGQVFKYDSFGNPTLFADSSDGLVGPIGVDVDRYGNVWIADVDGQQIIKFDPAGNPTLFANASDGLFTPVDVAVDSLGNVFVADTYWNNGTIWKFDSAGNSLGAFADTSDGILSPTGIAIEQGSNYIYVANYLIDTIVALTPTGSASLFADASDGIDGPWQLATPYVVPEPSTFLIWGMLGLMAAGCRWWRRRTS